MTRDNIEFQSLFAEPIRNGIYKSKEFQGFGTALVKMSQLFSERRIRSQGDGFDRVELSPKEKRTLLLQTNDLLFSRTSIVADGVGKCSLVVETDEELTWDSNIIRVRLRNDQASPEFFFYYFNSPAGRDLVKQLSSGAAVTTITGSGLAGSPVPCPPLPTQQRIASVLSAYDNLIEKNTKRIKILEEMARSLYREWFVNFRFPGYVEADFVSSHVGKIPKGWRPGTLGDLVDEIRDSVDPAELDPDTPYLGLEHLPRRSIALREWGKASQVQSTKLRARAGDILFGKIRPYFHKVGPAPLDAVCSSDTIILRARDREAFAVALGCVSSDPFVEHSSQTSHGTKMPRANWGVLKLYPCPLPPSSLLSRFSAVMGDTVKLLQNLVLRNRNLSATRDLLLPRLISGEIDVSSLPLEPAAS